MRLLSKSRTAWRYQLDQKEGMLLRMLVGEFPSAATRPARISRTGNDRKSAERERFLNESLAEHRRDLKKAVRKLLAAKLKSGDEGWRLSLNPGDRETLLQLLNDVRVECWHALGEPDNLDALPPGAPGPNQRNHLFMHLAGYFEYHLIENPAGDDSASQKGH